MLIPTFPTETEAQYWCDAQVHAFEPIPSPAGDGIWTAVYLGGL